MKKFLIFALAAAALIGCSPPATPDAATVKPTTSGDQPAPAPTSGSTTGTTEATPAASVPSELQNDAYHWYGLANSKAVKYKATITGMAPLTGTQTFSFKEVKDGKALFDIARTGGMEDTFGQEKLSLEKDGLYTLGTSTLKNSMHSLELPSDLPPGKTWKNSADLDMNSGQSMTTSQVFKVVGIEKIKTAVATRDALKIVGTGPMRMAGTDYQTTNTCWYVKDVGMVKSTTVLTAKKGGPKTILIEETP